MKKWRSYVGIIVLIFVVMICQIQVVKANQTFKSQGKIVYTNGTLDTSDDVIFDSEDFLRLTEVCK